MALNENTRKKVEDYLYNMLKESIMESDYFDNDFYQMEKKSDSDSDSHDSDDEDYDDNNRTGNKTGEIKLSQYDEEEIGAECYAKLKSIVPVLLDTFDESRHTFNFTHSQLAYELYPTLDPDVARSKFSQKVTGKKNFTTDEINQLSNIISSKIA